MHIALSLHNRFAMFYDSSSISDVVDSFVNSRTQACVDMFGKTKTPGSAKLLPAIPQPQLTLR